MKSKSTRGPESFETAETPDLLTEDPEELVPEDRRPGEAQKEAKSHLELGELGEKLACRYLWRRGFRIVERNFQGPRGEIDVIAEKGGRIHFIEVKTRTSGSLGAPEERVDHKKRGLLRETARAYLDQFHDAPPSGYQFDVLAQVLDQGVGKARQKHYELAF